MFSEDDTYTDELCDDVNIEQTEDGYKVYMAIPSAYFKYIIGKKAETKRKLELDTKTQIWIPRQGEKGNIGMEPFRMELRGRIGKNRPG